ncbi:ABC transporter substrate-binding protein [Haloarchaeobius sp. HME9146]|uniref:ABC transporter substrate-binding protein n=1 Tax=Haloarchaeobius sp. HME9146 TaxID=2978732 RepID=UPI0021C0D5E5|nr:ABC transporter substrate-binding protein [Haloarchaeobius sp. HME9146]MCT9096627.1 ABC transporter substrate-binding protein [Haloarchaeobius sp. HME9146]
MARNIQRRDVLKGAGLAGIAGLAGCVGGLGGGGGGSREIKYGVLMPVTGDLSSVGQPIRDGATLPGKQLNNNDDFGTTIDFQVEDTATSPQTGINAANTLVNAGYPGVCGPASSGVNIQVSNQVFIPNEVVGCSPSSTSPSVTTLEDDGYIFRTAPSDALQGQVMAQVGTSSIGASSAATLYVNNDYGQLLSQSFADAFKNEGGSVQKQVAFEKEQSSYSSKLRQALTDGPDLLVVIGYPASGVQLFKDYYADFAGDGSEEQILVTDGLQDPAMQEKIGNPMENVTGTAPQPSGPAADAFANLYEEEYGRAPGIFNAHAYDASATLILANAAGGENSGSVVRDNMQAVANPGGMEVTASNLAEGVQAAMDGDDVQYAGASSAVDYDDNGDMKAVTYSVWKFAPDSDSGIEVTDTINFSA